MTHIGSVPVVESMGHVTDVACFVTRTNAGAVEVFAATQRQLNVSCCREGSLHFQATVRAVDSSFVAYSPLERARCSHRIVRSSFLMHLSLLRGFLGGFASRLLKSLCFLTLTRDRLILFGARQRRLSTGYLLTGQQVFHARATTMCTVQLNAHGPVIGGQGRCVYYGTTRYRTQSSANVSA